MDQEMQGVFDRIDELINDLTREYESHIDDSAVTERAKNIFHEVLIKMRSALDITMMRIWLKYYGTNLSEADRKKARRNVYFPICDDRGEFDKRLKEMKLNIVNATPQLHTLLLQPQPFTTCQNAFSQLVELANLGKHVQLVEQNRESRPATRFVLPDGSIAVFTHGSGFHGDFYGELPIDPITRAPTGSTRKEINLVTFSIPHHGIYDPVIFCRSLQLPLGRYVPKLLTHI